MAVYTGSQDPTVTPTAGIAYEDRFDRSNGAQYVKGEPSGTNTDWFQTAAPAPSTDDPDTYSVDAEGGAQFTTIQDAIDQAVADGASVLSRKLIKVFPGDYADPFTLVAGINLIAPNGGVAVGGLVTVEGTSSIDALPGPSGTGIGLFGGLDIDGDTGSYLQFSIRNAAILSVLPSFSQTILSTCDIIFENCFVSAPGTSLFQTTDPTVFNTLNIINCRWGGPLVIDGRFLIKIRELSHKGFAFVNQGLTIQNNDIFLGELFTENPIQISNSQLKHIEFSNLTGAPAWIDNCAISSEAIAPFLGEAVLINTGGAIFTNCILGEPILGASNPLVDVPNGQFIALKTRLLTNNVGVNLGATAITQLYSAEIAASGVDRAVDGVAGGVVLLGNTLFLNDNRINPALTIVNSGTLAQASAGTDVSAPVAPGYQVA